MALSPSALASALLCLLAGFWLSQISRDPSALPLPLPFTSPARGEPAGNWAEYYVTAPYSSSWTSWWHRHRHVHSGDSNGGAGLGTQGRGQGGGRIDSEWNVLYHLGGNGPWVEKVEGVVEGGIQVPEGCEVEQVHMMSRHAERYPTIKAGNRMLDLLKRIDDANITFKGDLTFLNDWEYFTSDPQIHFEQLTTTGPFSGTLGAFTTGVKLRTRYHHLLPARLSHRGKTSFWAGDCSRVIGTARHFAAGFFGLNWADTATLHVIPETLERGADTLTPGDSCAAYEEDKEFGHDYGARMLATFRATYLDAVRQRLRAQNPHAGIEFSDADLYAMQEMCGFETTVRGSSPWCDVFTPDEWHSFEYARDVIHYYRAGPGNRFGALMGWLWLNATTNLLLEGPSAGPFFFSFVHDGDIVPMLAALDLFHDDEDLPVSRRNDKRAWKTSQVTPMGGRVIFERLSCRSAASSPASDDSSYVRININDGIVAIPGCDSGPGHSCPLSQWTSRILKRGNELGDFREKCGLSEEFPDRITFLHQ